MVDVRRLAAVLALSLAPTAPALAQLGSPTMTGAETGRRTSRLLPNFTTPVGDFREAGTPLRNGLIATLPIDDDLQLAVGRFRVAEPARPRTHMEPERAPTDLRRRERGVAAVGMSLRF